MNDVRAEEFLDSAAHGDIGHHGAPEHQDTCGYQALRDDL